MMFMFYKTSSNGNILFFILLSIVLLGLVTAAILQTSKSNRNDIDDETLRVHLSEVQQYANELERGIKIIMQNPISEYDIRFAHPDASPDYGDYSALSATPNILVFHPKGGGVTYQSPPEGVNDGSAWEFVATTALPQVGSDRADLIAVLPNVTLEFCELVNQALHYDPAIQPTDGATCLYAGAADRFDAGNQYDSTPNTVTEASFSIKPSSQACVQCGANYHYFYTLMAR
jgi:hypothetical protein